MFFRKNKLSLSGLWTTQLLDRSMQLSLSTISLRILIENKYMVDVLSTISDLLQFEPLSTLYRLTKLFCLLCCVKSLGHFGNIIGTALFVRDNRSRSVTTSDRPGSHFLPGPGSGRDCQISTGIETGFLSI